MKGNMQNTFFLLTTNTDIEKEREAVETLGISHGYWWLSLALVAIILIQPKDTHIKKCL